MGEWDVKTRPEWDHKLGHNKREWSPQRLLFLDTETGSEETEFGQNLPLRSWELCYVWRDKPEGHAKRERWYNGTNGLELAALLDDIVTTDKTHWLFAHNLGFDLSTTRLPVHLPRLGWTWTMGTITSDSPWMRWAKGNRKLTATDSYSHLPTSLAKIGDAIGLSKLAMPAFDAPAEQWDAYRHRDVEILKQAMLQYLEWWDGNKLGNLSVSGPASGWNCWRHTTKELTVQIEAEPETRKFGRTAIYGGRRSSWRVGDLGYGPWVELDIKRAHLSICRHEKMPTAVLGWVNGVPINHGLITSGKAGLVADCVVRTDTPRYPLLTEPGVLYPTGEFRTRLAGPELAEAARRGELVAVERALAVALGCPMKEWSEWIEAGLSGADSGVPPMARLAMKGWSRTVIGKWASRTSREVLRYPWPDQDWRVETGFYNHPDVPATTIYGNGEARTYVRDQESYDSFPAAYAWITSRMRCVLNRLVDLVGSKYLVACNTDSVVVHWDALSKFHHGRGDTLEESAWWAILNLNARMKPYRVTIKQMADKLRIRTPEHLVFGEGANEQRKIASVSHASRELQPWEFEGYVWPGLVKQITISSEEGFRLFKRNVNVKDALPLSWVDENGYCEPPRYVVDKEGNNQMQPPTLCEPDIELRGQPVRQHRELTKLLG